MRPAVIGIAYYMWVSRRRPLQVALSLTVCLGIVGLLPVGKDARTMCVTLAFMVALFDCAMLSFLAEGIERPQRIGFPRSLFALPVRTHVLVFWPWLFTTVSFGLWGVVCGNFLNWWAGTREPVVALFFSVPVWAAWFQVALWAPLRNLVARGLAFVFGIFLFSAFVARFYVRSGLSGAALTVVVVVCLVLTYLAALASVAADRHGDTWLSGLSRAGRLWPVRWRSMPLPFRSSVHALRWYIWWDLGSVFGRVFAAPMAVLAGSLFLFYCMGFPNHRTGETVHPHLLVCLFLILPVVVLLPLRLAVSFPNALGLDPVALGIDPFALQKGLSFVWLRPMSSGTLTAIFLQNILRAVLWSWALWLALGLGACLCLSAFSTPAHMWQETKLLVGRLAAWQTVGAVALSVVAVVGGTWKIATDGFLAKATFNQSDRWYYVGPSLAIFGLNGLVVVGTSLLLDPATRVPAVDALAGAGVVILAVKLIVALLAFRSANRNGLLEWLSLGRFFAVWLVLAAILLGTTAVIVSSLGLPVPTSLVLLWVAILLPLGRFALFPLSIEALRHR
jgi:hypothetical protein